jgi:hypothetical protein
MNGLCMQRLRQNDKYFTERRQQSRIILRTERQRQQFGRHNVPRFQQNGNGAVDIVVATEAALQILHPLQTVRDGENARHVAAGFRRRTNHATNEQQLIDNVLVDRETGLQRFKGRRGRRHHGLGGMGVALLWRCRRGHGEPSIGWSEKFILWARQLSKLDDPGAQRRHAIFEKFFSSAITDYVVELRMP